MTSRAKINHIFRDAELTLNHAHRRLEGQRISEDEFESRRKEIVEQVQREFDFDNWGIEPPLDPGDGQLVMESERSVLFRHRPETVVALSMSSDYAGFYPQEMILQKLQDFLDVDRASMELLIRDLTWKWTWGIEFEGAPSKYPKWIFQDQFWEESA